MSRRFVMLTVVFILSLGASCFAADQAAEIRQVVSTVEDSFNRGDAKGLAACWMPDGEFVGPAGNRIVGAEEIEAAFSEYFADHPDAQLRLDITSWRLVADDVALVDLAPELTPVPEGLHSKPVTTMVLVHRDGAWKIGSMYETLSVVPAHNLHLKKLQWLVGAWGEACDAPASDCPRSTCDWSSTGQYLIRKFFREGAMGETLSGTEVIGWDPRLHRIRSWTFHPDGSFGESAWTRDGEQWVIDYRGTLPDGSDLAATYCVTPIDADTLKVEGKDQRVNGEKQQAIQEVTLKRLAAGDKAEPAPIGLPEQVLP